jgi:hypothetical protein
MVAIKITYRQNNLMSKVYCKKHYMQPIVLDSANYAGTYKLIGEEVGFDLSTQFPGAIPKESTIGLIIQIILLTGRLRRYNQQRQAKILKEQPMQFLQNNLNRYRIPG